LVGSNKRVLELGPAAGHVTRALVANGCEVVGIEVEPEAAEGLAGVATCLVGDLNDPAMIAKAAVDGAFDVVLAGDVLEHLVNPLETLRAARRALVPGGYVVTSVPNIAHADVALALSKGTFTYRDWGLLDRTHIHFFTFDSLMEMMTSAGLMPTDVLRVVHPAFGTELGVRSEDFPSEVVEAVLSHSEAETYQFVVRAVRWDGDLEVSMLADRAIRADERARRERAERLLLEAEVTRLRSEGTTAKEALAATDRAFTELSRAVVHYRDLADQFESQVREMGTLVRDLEAQKEEALTIAENQARHVEALLATKTMRALAIPRGVYGRLRRAGR
jgi:SAM-dependent methyltransferase